MAYSKGEVNRAGKRLAVAVREGGLDVMRAGEHAADLAAVGWWVDEHRPAMEAVLRIVRAHTPAPAARIKRVPTVIDKLTREPGRLTDMVDLGGVRAVAADATHADATVERLANDLDVRRVRDRMRSPGPSGYRAIHLHVRHDGRMIEVQVRTSGQHRWANLVEIESRESGFNYKAGQGHPAVLRLLRAMSDFNAMIELGEPHPNVAREYGEALAAASPLVRSSELATLVP